MPSIKNCKILMHQEVGPDHYRMGLHAPAIAQAAEPGQFCMVQVAEGLDPFLRRPMSFERIFPDGVVTEVHLEIPAESWQAMLADPRAEEYYEANLIYGEARRDRVAARFKGNSSLAAPAREGEERFSFKIDLNRIVPGQTLDGLKKLNFNNGFHDPTFMREHLARYKVPKSVEFLSELPISAAGKILKRELREQFVS